MERVPREDEDTDGLSHLTRAHQVPHHAAPQHGQGLVVKVWRAHA